jgi:hypothetical protein
MVVPVTTLRAAGDDEHEASWQQRIAAAIEIGVLRPIPDFLGMYAVGPYSGGRMMSTEGGPGSNAHPGWPRPNAHALGFVSGRSGSAESAVRVKASLAAREQNEVVSSKAVVQDPDGVKYVVRAIPRGAPFDWVDIFWLGGWVAHILFFWDQWKVEVTKFAPSGRRRLRRYEPETWTSKAYESMEDARRAARGIASKIEAGSWVKDV